MEALGGVKALQSQLALTRAWDDALIHKRFGLAILRGVSGSGLTTMLELLYAHCAMGQPRRPYWPRTLQEGLTHRERPSHGQRSLHPNIANPNKTDIAIPYFWWNLTPPSEGSALLAGRVQIDSHLVALREAIQYADKAARNRLLAALKATLLVGSLLPLGAQAAAAVSLIQASMDSVEVDAEFTQAFKPVPTLIDEARRRNRDRVVSLDGPVATARYADNEGIAYSRLAAILPFCVVVDHSERLDEVTIRFLQSLIREEGAVGLLVLNVTTDAEWTSGPTGGNPALADWLAKEERGQTSVTSIQLSRLAPEEAVDLARSELSVADLNATAMAAVVEASHGLAGRLNRLLSIPTVNAAVRTGSQLPEDLARFATPNSVLSAEIEQLSDVSRRALVALSIQGSITPVDWLPDWFTSVDLDAAMATGWVRRSSNGWLEFASADGRQALLAVKDEELSPAEQAGIYDALVTSIMATYNRPSEWAELDAANVVSAVSTYVANRGTEGLGSEVLAEFLRLRRTTGLEAADERLLAQLKVRLRDSSTDQSSLVSATAEALHDAGEDQEALDIVNAEFSRIAAPSRTALARIAGMMAYFARERVGTSEAESVYGAAVATYHHLLALTSHLFDAQDPRLARTLWELADLQGDFSDFGSAADTAQQAIDAFSVSDLGPYGVEVLDKYMFLAKWTADAGRPIEGRTLLEEKIDVIEDELGETDVITLNTRVILAHCLDKAGENMAAIAEFEQVLATARLALGDSHDLTLEIMNSLAVCRTVVGDYAEAKTLLRTVVRERHRSLSSYHDVVLTAINNYIRVIELQGQVALAVRMLSRLAHCREYVSGPLHPRSLRVKANLARVRLEVGEAAVVHAELTELLPVLTHVLGPADSDTYYARMNLAIADAQLGNAQIAYDSLVEVVIEAQETLGGRSPVVLGARYHIGKIMSAFGADPVDTRVLLSDLLADARPVLGDNSELILATQQLLSELSPRS